jgi:hypothetical protein
MPLCDTVKDKPEKSKIIVFSKGKPQGLIVFKPCGGQTFPIQTEGIKAL